MKKQTCGRCHAKIDDTNSIPGEELMTLPFCSDCYVEMIGEVAVADIMEWC